MAIIDYMPIGSELEFRNSNRKDVIGNIFQVEISITKESTNVVYHVVDEKDKYCVVDGETFMQI